MGPGARITGGWPRGHPRERGATNGVDAGRAGLHAVRFRMEKPPLKPAGAPSPASDDRPLVGADPLASQVDWTDRALLWWDDNRRMVGMSVAALLVAIVGWQSYLYVQDRREKGVQDTYAVLVEPADLLAFAQAHANHPLGGTAYLKLADQAYTAERFAEAAERYAEAAKILAATPFGDRARLGHGMAQLRAGKHAEAAQSLEALREDAKAAVSIRAEAAYQLAVHRWETGKAAEAKTLLVWVTQLEDAGFWAQRAQGLLDEHADFR